MNLIRLTSIKRKIRPWVGLVPLAFVLALPLQTVYASSVGTVLINQAELGTADGQNKSFVNLYNPSSVAVDLSRWEIDTYAKSGAGPNTRITFPDGSAIGAKDYLLLAGPPGSPGDPKPDFALPSPLLQNDVGSIAVVDDKKQIIDFIRFSTARMPAGIPSFGPSAMLAPNGASLSRDSDHANTQNNAADFSVQLSPAPIAAQTAGGINQFPAVIIYTQNNGSGTEFGQGPITAAVTIEALQDDPANGPTSLVLTPTQGSPLTVPLHYDAAKQQWTGTYNPAFSQLDDGAVTATLNSNVNSLSYPITTGKTFTLHTHVADPVVSMVTMRPPGQEDSFIASDPDSAAQKIYVYSSPALDAGHLVTVANLQNGTTGEVYIGDNTYPLLYLVAEDALGNRSGSVMVNNDVIPPDAPNLSFSRHTGSIDLSWDPVADASAYVLRWRPAGSTDWQEQIVTGNSITLPADDAQSYEITLASRDAAGNTSTAKAVSVPSLPGQITLSSVPISESAREKTVFAKAWNQSGEKDHLSPAQAAAMGLTVTGQPSEGGVQPASPVPTPSPTGKPSATNAPHNTTSPAPSATAKPQASAKPYTEQLRNFFRNNSKWVIALAIGLIIVGAALAIYSGFHGEPPHQDGGSASSESALPPPAPAARDRSPKSRRNRSRRRKTEW